MNQKECINKIFNEVMFSKPDHPLTIVCCFHSRRDMQNFIQSFYDKWKIKSHLETVTMSDCLSTTVLDNRIFFLHENYKNIDGLTPDLLFFQKRPFYYSNLVDVLKHKTLGLKHSEIYSFE